MKHSPLLFCVLILAGLVWQMPTARAAESSTRSLVAAWNFDETTGDQVKDISGHGHVGTLCGAKRADGKFGRAVECSQDVLVEVPHAAALDDFKDGITVSAWVNRGADSSWNTVISREIRDTWSEYFGLAVVKNKALFSIDPDGAHYLNIKSDEDVPAGEWVHLAGTYDNGMLKLYVNGRLVKSAPWSGTLKLSDTNPLIIGGNSNSQGKKTDRWGAWVDCFHGRIDEVRLYNRPLTDPEVLQIMSLSLGTTSASPVGANEGSRATSLQPSGGDLPSSIIQSWLANSFSQTQGHQFVPVNVSGIAVTPDGTVFSSGVAEGYGGVASYKDGKFVTKYDYESGFGSSSSAVAADDSYVYIGTGVGLFRTRRGDEFYNRTTITGGDIQGLALRDGELYLSDFAASKIRVLSTATMKEVRAFAAPSPGTLAVAADGRIWVVQGKPGKEPFYSGGLKVISFSKGGMPGPEITDFESPCALTLDSKGRLLVGGLNKHSQVWIYDASGTPRKVGTFGTEGGIFSGEPGQYQPQKFHWIRGLGFDAAGNLYVAGVFGSWYNVLIEAYSPSGQRLWDVYGLGNWLDTACTDPANENIVYTKENVFTMDWSKLPGREQSLAGLTVDRFKYPRDNRVVEGHGPGHRLINGVRRIHDKLFLYCGGQGTSSLEIYKLGEQGFVAAPCGYVAGASPWRPGNGTRWPEDAETFIWTDRNGDGVPDPAEFASVNRKPRWGFMHLDAAAGIWQCSGDGTIFHLRCEGLDPRGNPIYRRASEVSYKHPPEFPGDRLRRLFYIPGDDVLIAGGSPGTEENACNLLIRFDHWSDPAQKTQRWTINLPLNDKSYTPSTGYGGGAPQAMQACGKYLFVAYGYGLIRVHRLDDGGYVGTIRPDINGFKGSGGCVDSDNALNVTLRKNGEYVLFLENAGLNHVMMFRWTPPGTNVGSSRGHVRQ